MRHACGIIGFLALTLVAAPATAQDIMQGNVSPELAPTILYMK